MFLDADSVRELQSPLQTPKSVLSENSLNSFTTAEPVVRYLKVAQLKNGNWELIYSLESDTARLLLEGERKKKTLEKTSKKKKEF